MTLRERILARLALAEAATGTGPWWTWAQLSAIEDTWMTPCFDNAEALFIADRSPDRVIAECRADLALLDWHKRVIGDGEAGTSVLTNLNARYPEGDA